MPSITHPRELRACAEPRRAAARRGEAPWYIFMYLQVFLLSYYSQGDAINIGFLGGSRGRGGGLTSAQGVFVVRVAVCVVTYRFFT